MLSLLTKLPQYPVARYTHTKVPLPINITCSLTYRCQSRCATCRIYNKSSEDELNSEEWGKIFQSLGNTPYWTTFSGGEPFLYKDLPEVYYLLVKHCNPAIINIPTNGQAYDRILDYVWQMIKLAPRTKLIVNLSLDHCNERENDEIRGIKGYYHNALQTLDALLKHDAPNFTVGIHTVISRFNVTDFVQISEKLSSLLKDKSHYICEIAENRYELGTVGINITPKYGDYQQALQQLNTLIDQQPKTLIRAFRREYYSKIIKWFNGGKIPCYAGYSSAQIAPNGDVWFCCIKAESIGNLRDYNYDFNALWNNGKAELLREDVLNCAGCPLANVSYTNSLFHLPTLVRVARQLI